MSENVSVRLDLDLAQSLVEFVYMLAERDAELAEIAHDYRMFELADLVERKLDKVSA